MALIEGDDYYLENGCYVFTARYLLARGRCCGSGCRHCPYRDQPSSRPPQWEISTSAHGQPTYEVNWASRHGSK